MIRRTSWIAMTLLLAGVRSICGAPQAGPLPFSWAVFSVSTTAADLRTRFGAEITPKMVGSFAHRLAIRRTPQARFFACRRVDAPGRTATVDARRFPGQKRTQVRRRGVANRTFINQLILS